MEVVPLDKMFRGWFIGDFEPSVFKTSAFEIGYLYHKKDEYWPAHYHEKIDEYNLLIKGKMLVNDKIINENEIFIIPKGIVSNPKFLEDSYIICIKTPSIPGDKILV